MSTHTTDSPLQAQARAAFTAVGRKYFRDSVEREASAPDFTVANHGSICVLTGKTEACKDWINANVGDEETQKWCGGKVIEHRYVGPIVSALQSEGFIGEAE